MSRSILIAALTLASLLGLRAAQSEGLLEIYRLATESDPQIRAAAAAYRATLEQRPQSLALLLPSLEFRAGSGRNRQDIDTTGSGGGISYFDTGNFRLSLTQVVYRRDLYSQLRQADTRIAGARAVFDDAQQALILRVAERYFDALGAADTLIFAHAQKTATARQLEQAQQRFEVGLIAITDVHEAQAAFDLDLANEIIAENRLSNTREALREVTGRYHQDLHLLTERLPLLAPEPADIDQWAEAAGTQNLALQAAQFATETAREEIERQRSGHYPSIDLVASHGYSESGGRFGDSESTDSAIGLELSVPIYQGGLISSRAREARRLFEQAQEFQEQRRRAAVRESRESFLGVQAALSRVKALDQARVSTQSALEAVEAGFEVGSRTIVDVLEALREVHQAQRDYARERYAYILNTLRLKSAVGALLPSDLEVVDAWLEKAAGDTELSLDLRYPELFPGPWTTPIL